MPPSARRSAISASFWDWNLPTYSKNPWATTMFEPSAVEPDRLLQKVYLEQVRRGLLDGYVHAVVVNIRLKQGRECSGTTANVEECAIPAAGERIRNMRYLYHPRVRPAVVQVLRAPEVLLVEYAPSIASWTVSVRALQAIHRCLASVY